jgi:hypothetical protein
VRQLTVDLSLTSTRVIDERLVLLDYRVADRAGAGDQAPNRSTSNP